MRNLLVLAALLGSSSALAQTDIQGTYEGTFGGSNHLKLDLVTMVKQVIDSEGNPAVKPGLIGTLEFMIGASGVAVTFDNVAYDSENNKLLMTAVMKADGAKTLTIVDCAVNADQKMLDCKWTASDKEVVFQLTKVLDSEGDSQ